MYLKVFFGVFISFWYQFFNDLKDMKEIHQYHLFEEVQMILFVLRSVIPNDDESILLKKMDENYQIWMKLCEVDICLRRKN